MTKSGVIGVSTFARTIRKEPWLSWEKVHLLLPVAIFVTQWEEPDVS